MTHDEIEAQNLTELYVTHRLSPEESARFEEHFVDCPECLDRIESAELLRKGMTGANRTPAVQSIPRRWPTSAWLAAAALVVIGFSAFLWTELRFANFRR